MANSMGGEVVVSAFSELYQNAEMADPQTEIEHVVLTAPDISHAEFGSTFKPKILALSEAGALHAASADATSALS